MTATADTAMDEVNAATNRGAIDEVTSGSTYEQLQHASRPSAADTQYARLETSTRGRQSSPTGCHSSTVYVNVDRGRN